VDVVMVVTPYDRRRITAAVFSELPDAARDRWMEWVRPHSPLADVDVPYPIAEIILEAVRAEARTIHMRLADPQLHEDVRADLINDLSFNEAIEAEIAESVGH
jgi:hypothetical protein